MGYGWDTMAATAPQLTLQASPETPENSSTEICVASLSGCPERGLNAGVLVANFVDWDLDY